MCNCKAKLSWYKFFVAPPVAQDQRSYSICVLSHEYAADFSSDVHCSAGRNQRGEKKFRHPWKNVLDIF